MRQTLLAMASSRDSIVSDRPHDEVKSSADTSHTVTSIQLLSATQGASVTGTAISASVSTTLSGASSLSAASSGSLTASKTTSVASASSSSTSASASASATGEPSLKDKWEDLGIAAHVGIYVGGALLLLVRARASNVGPSENQRADCAASCSSSSLLLAGSGEHALSRRYIETF